MGEDTGVYFEDSIFLKSIYLSAPGGMLDLSSLTRDGTQGCWQ